MQQKLFSFPGKLKTIKQNGIMVFDLPDFLRSLPDHRAAPFGGETIFQKLVFFLLFLNGIRVSIISKINLQISRLDISLDPPIQYSLPGLPLSKIKLIALQ